jgi:hypothetical protein
MSDSLHQTALLEKFAGWAYLLWGKWNSYVASGANTKAILRENQFRGYINALCAEVHIRRVPSYIKPLTDAGGFDRSEWKLEINDTEFSNDDVILSEYVEVCKTAIHELRHAEQYYRMAQGLYLGHLEFPGGIKKKKKKVSLVASANPEAVTADDIEAALDLPRDVTQDAINNSVRYENFAQSAPLSHCAIGKVPNRPTDKWTLTVDDWLQRRFDPRKKKWGSMGLAMDRSKPKGSVVDLEDEDKWEDTYVAVIDGAYYSRGELDTDTQALEALLEGLLKKKWNNYGSVKDKGRKNAVAFPPPPLAHPPVHLPAHPPVH